MHIDRTFRLSLLCAAALVAAGCATTAVAPPPAAAVPAAAPPAAAPSPFGRPRRAAARPPAGAASGTAPAAPARTAGAGAAAGLRHRDQGRQGDRGPVRAVAEGREGLDRASARGLQQAVLPLAEDGARHRRDRPVRRLDVVPGARVDGPHRRVPPRQQHRPAAGAEQRLPGPRPEVAGSARGGRRLRAEPAVERTGGQRRASRAQDVLVDAGSLLLNDMLGIGAALQRAYRQGYSLEGRNTQISQVRGKPDAVVFNIDATSTPPTSRCRRPADRRARRCRRHRARCPTRAA